jgi:hypothetical protein
MKFYQAYHLDAKGETASLTNFMAANDADACENALVVLGNSKWPGLELRECGRHVHCAGVARSSMGPPDNDARRHA